MIVLLNKWSESVFIIIIIVVCHEFMFFSLLNTWYFEILTFLSEGLSLDFPFNLGRIVKTIVELGMNSTTVPMWRVGGRG